MAKPEQISKTKYLRAKRCTNCKETNTEMKPIGLQYYHPVNGVPYENKRKDIHTFRDACLNAPDVYLLCNDCGAPRLLSQMEVTHMVLYEDNHK